MDQGAAVIGHPQLEPVGSPRQLGHAPLAPVLQSVDVDINVVAPGSNTLSPCPHDQGSPVRSVLDMRQAEDVEQLVGAPDVVHSAPALGHRSQHQHVGAGPPEVTCSKGVKALLWIRILITYGVSA